MTTSDGSQNEAQPPYHPILYELNLINLKKSKRPGITALSILNRLLETKVLSAQVVCEAHDALAKSEESNVSGNPLDRRDGRNLETNPPNVQKKCKEDTVFEISAKPRHRSRHVALKFYYDGAKYNGLAQNVGNEKDQSVEKALFQALIKARLVESREASGYSRCGRTDRGVSAAGQVVAFRNMKSAIPIDATFDPEGKELISNDQLPKNSVNLVTAWVLPKKKDKRKKNAGSNKNGEPDSKEDAISRQEKQISEYPYDKILNNLLPEDIRILGWCPVSEDFSARFSATTRTYRYFFVQRQMDLSRIRKGMELLVGTHDFRNFCKMDVEKVYNFERLIHSAELKQVSPSPNDAGRSIWFIQIVGQAFLWHQIRCIVSILFMIGKGLEPPSVITELFDIGRFPGKPSYQLAPEFPLVLHDCGYPNLRLGHSVQNIWSVCCQLEHQWEELILAGARIRNCIGNLESATVWREDLEQFAVSKVKERQKKRQKVVEKNNSNSTLLSDAANEIDSGATSSISECMSEEIGGSGFVLWKDALQWLIHRGLVPDSNGLSTTSFHIPLLERSVGPTYEEKISALQKSDKRRQRYEDNVIKKRKSASEDAAFYAHMTRQGGTGV